METVAAYALPPHLLRERVKPGQGFLSGMEGGVETGDLGEPGLPPQDGAGRGQIVRLVQWGQGDQRLQLGEDRLVHQHRRLEADPAMYVPGVRLPSASLPGRFGAQQVEEGRRPVMVGGRDLRPGDEVPLPIPGLQPCRSAGPTPSGLTCPRWTSVSPRKTANLRLDDPALRTTTWSTTLVGPLRGAAIYGDGGDGRK